VTLIARACIVALIASPVLLCGCQAMALPWLLFGEEPTKTVPAEFPHLHNQKVAILVWADSDTLFEFQHVQYELSEFVASAMKPAVKGVSFVPNRSLVDYQRGDPQWDRKPPAKIGAKFSADRVLVIELSQYTTREPDSPHIYRAHIAGTVKVYDTANFDAGPLFKTTVQSMYPVGAAGDWGTSEDAIRKAGMEAFSAEVAGKFHDRQVKGR
jgi:hypothetical protein